MADHSAADGASTFRFRPSIYFRQASRGHSRCSSLWPLEAPARYVGGDRELTQYLRNARLQEIRVIRVSKKADRRNPRLQEIRVIRVSAIGCERGDSNLHGIATASPSSCQVCVNSQNSPVRSSGNPSGSRDAGHVARTGVRTRPISAQAIGRARSSHLCVLPPLAELVEPSIVQRRQT